jgi:hypothetical protein
VPASSLNAIHVSAKVVRDQTAVPSLPGAVFNRDAVLEKGIHVHWALPDSLTRAKLLPKGGANVARFPGVPDVWLVIRFNPGPPIEQVNAKRSWRAWVVDSIAGTAVPLASWVAPLRDPALIHTVAGVLPSGTGQGYPGWGLWSAAGPAFDPAVAAYYPASRHRLGFYDSGADLSGSGKVSYVVIGWFGDRGHDPLHVAKDRLGLLNDWHVAHHLSAAAYVDTGTSTVRPGTSATKPNFAVQSITVQQTELPPGKQAAFAKAAAKGGTPAALQAQTAAMKAGFPVSQAASQAVTDMVATARGPVDLILHGSCVEVPLGGATTSAAPIHTTDIRLFPTVRRAMAEVAAAETGSAEQVDAVEMMLDDLESMKSSLAGVLDMPGMAHAATFQNVPGRSRWYARLEIHPAKPLWQSANQFDVISTAMGPGLQATGHWPPMALRSIAHTQQWMLATYAPALLYHAPPVPPPQLTETEFGPWREKVRKAFTDTKAATTTPIHPTLMQIVDRRSDAQSGTTGHVAGRGGSDGSGWWIDISEGEAGDAALNELLRCVGKGKVVLPNVDNLLEIPGTRWNRPWSPQLVLFGVGRSYKFGFDSRFRTDGFTTSRQSGETLTSMAVGSHPRVFGKDILDKPAELFAKAGVPPEARAIIQEALLLDTESTTVMARLASSRTAPRETLLATQKQMKSAVRGLWLSRDTELVAASKPKLDAINASGTFPSNIAISPWQDPRDPVFIDVSYAHPFSTLESDWTLEQDHVEMAPNGAQAANPPAGQVEIIEERTYVTATVPTVLEQTLVTKETADVSGHLVLAQKPPKDVTAETFKKLDVISAPLTAFDSTLLARGHRQRTGALRVDRLQLVDIYGFAREWKSGVEPSSSVGSEAMPFWIKVAPRLPYWARLQFRLQQADNPAAEAHPLAHPVCGILVPDFVEHAVEVFDGEGRPIGQITTDAGRFGGGPNTPADALEVRFELHPWVEAKLNLGPGANHLDGITNWIMRSFVASVQAQGTEIPADADKTVWFETGLSAMMRAIDTVRATLDPTKTTKDKRVQLLGEPILVLAAQLTYEATPATSLAELTSTPPAMPAPPAMPVLSVRVGDSTRPDDGTLGCFIAGATDGEGRFAPVTVEAAEKAILNGLALGVPFFVGSDVKVTHAFVKDQQTLFGVAHGAPTDVVILADPRGGLYASCGALPRKKITMPEEFIRSSLQRLEPTFRAGPLLTSTTMASIKTLAPPPQIEGHEVEYVYRAPGVDGGPDTFPEAVVSPVPPVGEVPRGRVTLSEGWMRVFRPEEG